MLLVRLTSHSFVFRSIKHGNMQLLRICISKISLVLPGYVYLCMDPRGTIQLTLTHSTIHLVFVTGYYVFPDAVSCLYKNWDDIICATTNLKSSTRILGIRKHHTVWGSSLKSHGLTLPYRTSNSIRIRKIRKLLPWTNQKDNAETQLPALFDTRRHCPQCAQNQK